LCVLLLCPQCSTCLPYTTVFRSETLDIIDRAYILHDGRVLMEGGPDEIVRNDDVRRVYLGDRFSL